MNRHKPNPRVQSKLLLIWAVFMYILVAVALVADHVTRKRNQSHLGRLETYAQNARFESIGTYRDE